MGLDLSAFLDDFRAEATEHLRALDAQLLALERAPDDPAPIRAMFLAAHSLKGSAAMMDIADVEALAHAIEDVLARLRDGQRRLDAALADQLFRAFDLLGERIARALPGEAPIDAPITAAIGALAAQATAAPGIIVPQAPIATNGAGPRALLVEDSATVRLLHAALLAEEGFAVDAVAEGSAALALAEARRYDLIVGGLETGGLRGPELAAALHQRLGAAMPPFVVTQNAVAGMGAPRPTAVAALLQVESPNRQQLTAIARELCGQRDLR